MSSPLARPEIWDNVAPGYEKETMPAFAQFCREMFRLSGYEEDARTGLKVMDIACGPGTLSLLLGEKAAHVEAIDFSPKMLKIFQRLRDEKNLKRITIQQMDGQNLEYPTDEFDYAFSNFGLMFFPDRGAGFREMLRVLKPGGRAGVSSWAPMIRSSLMQIGFGAFQAAFPPAPVEGPVDPPKTLDDPDNFRKEMEAAGFQDVKITPFQGSWVFQTHEELIQDLEEGTAPITMAKKNNEEIWPEKRRIMLEYLRENLPNLPATLHSQAYIGTGRKPQRA